MRPLVVALFHLVAIVAIVGVVVVAAAEVLEPDSLVDALSSSSSAAAAVNVDNNDVDDDNAPPPPSRRCKRRYDNHIRLNDECREWLLDNPWYVLPSRSPDHTSFPTISPSDNPTIGPSVYHEIEMGNIIVTRVFDDDDDDDDDEGAAGGEGGGIIEKGDVIDVDSIVEDGRTTTTSSSSGGRMMGVTRVDASITVKLGPTDDAFIELSTRSDEPLGNRSKLKIDATNYYYDPDEGGGGRKDGGGIVRPNKVALLRFGLGDTLNDIVGMGATETVLASARLRMFPLADADFGGYVTGMPARRGGKKGGDDIYAKNDDWNEETVVWTDYADADGRGAMKFLPDDNDPGGGRWSSTVVVVDEITTGIRTRMPRNPEYGRFEGTVKAMEWIEADVTDAVRDVMFDTTAEDTDDNEAEDDGKDKEETKKNKKKRSMSLMISTDKTDGVIYASKEDWSGNGPYLELRFELKGLSVANPPTLEPSRSPVAPLVRPFKPNEAGGIDDMTPIVEVINTTSVVSSSFRMTLTAIETVRRRDRPLRRAGRRLRDGSSHTSLEEKEEPAIVEHLMRVYGEVLSIAPIGVSLAFEEDLVLEEISTGTGGDSNGAIRKSVFRVMAVFDDPEVEKMPFEAIGILDEATVYAFVGQEELGFIEVFKSYGDPIVDDPAEYDVTVLKVDYSAPVEDDFQGSSATVANAAIEGEGNEGGSSTPPPSSPSWIKPAFIAGASAVAFASTAAALLLWRQRRGDAYVDDGHKKPEDSPRSLDPTAVPSTPSPAVFMDRFNKKKTQFNYAEFEDGNVDVEEPSFCAEGDAVISPRTNSNGRSGSNRHPTNDIEYAERDTSFDFYDDSSVSDVSAHLLGARGSIRKNDTNEAESVLLDTTMESYNMEAMSAMDQVRFEDVLNVDGSSSTAIHGRAGGIVRVTSDDEVGCSLSTGAVPSEMYSNLSLDESDKLHNDTSNLAAYGGHLFTLDLLRNKDSSLVEMPPPPSDVASDASSQQDVGEDFDAMTTGMGDDEFASTGRKNEQDAVSQSINDELTRVMKLLESPNKSEEGVGESVDRSHYIGTVAGHTVENGSALGNDEADNSCYEGLSVIVNDESEPDETNPLKQMNEALSDCRDILQKARSHNGMPSNSSDGNEKVAAGWNSPEEEESSLVTEQID